MGTLYGLDSALGLLIRVDRASGVGTSIGETGLTGSQSLAYDSTAATLFATARPTATLPRPFLATLDRATGLFTLYSDRLARPEV